MTDFVLLSEAYYQVGLVKDCLIADATHANIVKARDHAQTALSHIQELENRFRQGLITNEPIESPPTSSH